MVGVVGANGFVGQVTRVFAMVKGQRGVTMEVGANVIGLIPDGGYVARLVEQMTRRWGGFLATAYGATGAGYGAITKGGKGGGTGNVVAGF